MTKSSKPDLSPAEQGLLDHVTVRLIRPEERAAFDELLIQEHYLHKAELVGEQLRYVAEYDGHWVALLTWNAAAFNLRRRETWIGWTAQQKKRRLTLVVNNSRFVVRVRVPNLASRVMKGCVQRVSSDWRRTYGHEVLVAGRLVQLTLTEFRILHLLAQRPGWVFTRSQIIDATQGDEASVTARSVDVHIVSLRRKLGLSGDMIETIRGIGYRFKEEV